jgi:hypothetical protein
MTMTERKLVQDPDPEVARWVEYATWPDDEPFPLTPLEAWYLMKGFAVRPAAGLTDEQFFKLPGDLEGGGKGPGGWLIIRGR